MNNELLPAVISPEGLKIAETYLEQKQDINSTAKALGLDKQEVARYLATREVKSYIDQIFYDAGFRNRSRMFAVMDELINRKLEELEESGMGTSYDIVDLIKTYHKMQIDQMKMEREVAATHISKQTNVQINGASGGGSNYTELLARLIK